MKTTISEWLKTIEVLREVPSAQLQWFAKHSTSRNLATGEHLFEVGDVITSIYVIISGKVNLVSAQNRITATLETADISGVLPYSRLKTAASASIAAIDSEVLLFPIAKSRELVRDHYELTEALVHIMLSRVRDYTSLQQQNEKMMALGKLSAGLAHELNNPASAIVRDAHSLQKHLALLPDSFKDVMNIRMSTEEVDAVNDVLFKGLDKDRPLMSLLQRTEREEELVDWLQKKGIPNGGELAESFADFGFGISDLEGFAQHVPQPSLKAIFKWISDNIATDKIVGDIGEAAHRIEKLISAIKTFTHMDRGSELQFTDIHAGIRSTLTMLGHKIRKDAIKVEESYDINLPSVKVMIGELNQVWTNLIDNALDAMDGTSDGILSITTLREGEFVRVTIADNGEGIPDDIKARIFDPFFTTKDIGKGTGLGLDVVHRIVQQHRGTVKVVSVPGKTEFVICFPING